MSKAKEVLESIKKIKDIDEKSPSVGDVYLFTKDITVDDDIHIKGSKFIITTTEKYPDKVGIYHLYSNGKTAGNRSGYKGYMWLPKSTLSTAQYVSKNMSVSTERPDELY